MAESSISQTHSLSRTSQRIARGINACQRCRRRKQKCDLKYPNCSNCEGAQVSCLTYHLGKQVELPRNYVSNLEAQITKLTQENEELRTRIRANPITSVEPSPPTRNELVANNSESLITSNRPSIHLQDLVESVKDVVVEPSGRQARFLGQSGGITLASLVMAAIRTDALPPPLFSRTVPYQPSSSMMAEESSLPPRHAADHLVDVYFQYRTPHLPIIERSQVKEALDGAYRFVSGNGDSEDPVSKKDIFTVYMIFAIALCGIPNPSGIGRPNQSEGCFRSAIGWVENVIAYSKSDLESLRCTLLLAQFVALCPSHGSLWHLTGIALRMCIDIGLHWESDEQRLSMDPKLLYDRRRLWYSTYHFDRSLCITLGRPFGIVDESTRVELPNPWTASSCRSIDDSSDLSQVDIHNQQSHNHLFKLSQLESEIIHVQHSQSWTVKIAYPRTNYSVWVKDIEPRLLEWYTTIPEIKKAHPSSIFSSQAYWDVIYNNAVLLLHRPNSMVPNVSIQDLSISFKASCHLIASIKALQREGKIDVLWKSVHHLFMAGLGVIYCLWHSKEIRDQHSVGSCISTLQSCASTLSSMSETFHRASGCRDVFEILSSTTINWLVTYESEKMQQSRQEFEDQVKELLQQLHPSRKIMSTANENRTNMSAMLATDNFAFSELLSSAAQWPDFQDIDFDEIVLNPV